MKTIKIGKAEENDFVINDDSTVSRYHIQLFIDEEANVFLTDLHSTNGTFVNGLKVIEPVLLNSFDILRIGNTLINWKEFLLNDVNSQDAFKTILDDNQINGPLVIGEINDQLDFDESNQDDFPKKKSYAWYIAATLLLLSVGLGFYFSSHNQIIIGTWTSDSCQELSYEFRNDGTFSKDSAGIKKDGTFKLVNEVDQTIKLSFSENSLPVFQKVFKTDLKSNLSFPKSANEDELSEDYFGNVFDFTNKSNFAIKLLSVDHDVSNKYLNGLITNVYIYNDSHKKLNSIQNAEDGWKYFERRNDWTLIFSETDNNTIEINPFETISFFIISNTAVNISSVENNSKWGKSNDFILDNCYKGQTFNDDLYFNVSEELLWSGGFTFGLMRSEFDYEYILKYKYLEIDGQSFKK
tara:strand:- start:8859 stop:10085 length:1227 start_codon:yes stop_codon:yes gene_type:complete